MSTLAQSFTPSIAAEPVSPLVAPTIVTRSPRSASTWSNSRPTSCRATSLNASVGPWNSSSSQWWSPICTSGTTAAWRNVAYASSHSRSERRVVDLAADERRHDRARRARRTSRRPATSGSAGHVAGTYRPPSVARPASSTSAKPSSGARPRVRDVAHRSAADHAQQAADPADDVEVAQLAHASPARPTPSPRG